MTRVFGQRVGWWLAPPLVIMILMALAYSAGGYKQVKLLGLAGCLPLGLILAVILRAVGVELPWHGPGGEYIIAVMLIANWYMLSWVFRGLRVLRDALQWRARQ